MIELVSTFGPVKSQPLAKFFDRRGSGDVDSDQHVILACDVKAGWLTDGSLHLESGKVFGLDLPDASDLGRRPL